MTEPQTTVFIVDDDPAIRDSLKWLVESVDLSVRCFATGLEFLAEYSPDWRGCVILDIRMPGMSGIELFEELCTRDSAIPVLFLTGHGDVHLAVRAMKNGAFDFVEKPFNDQQLLDVVQKAIRFDAEWHAALGQMAEIKNRLSALTVREREVLDGVVQGLSNRAIAESLELSEKTIEFHRAKMMEKMKAGSLAELVMMITTLERLDGRRARPPSAT